MYRPRRHADPAKLPPTWATSFTGTTGAGRSCAQIAPFGRFPGGHADDRAPPRLLADIAVLRDGGDVTVGNQTPRLALAGTEPRDNSVIGDVPYMTSAIMLVCGLV